MPVALRLKKELVNCLLCGRHNDRKIHAALPNVVSCACGLVYTTPRLCQEDFLNLYSREYFESHSSETMGYDNYVSDKELVEKTFRRRLASLERRWVPQKGKVLDVGCATGFFLTIAREMGWRVDGVEISKFCCEYAEKNFGLKLHHGFFKDVEGLESGYQLVTMWDYLEHSLNPDKDLERAYSLLRPGGFVAIATPDISSFPAKIFKENWMGFKEHEHLYYFSMKNLSTLVEKCGFRITSRSYAGKYISSKFFVKRLTGYFKSLGGLADGVTNLPFLKNAAFYCNPMDICYIIAQK